ncbi:MAG: aryl-sulfate sulfotransferase [Chloroflexi bacterium]|nr:aryl-sulfate sulfotransferase [Chloroflexota bacterium]
MKRLLVAVILPSALLACQPVFIDPLRAPSSAEAPVYIQPRASAQRVLPQTTIAVRYSSTLLADKIHPDLFVVQGARSGPHKGMAVLSDDQRTIIFTPLTPFTPGESMSARFEGGALGTAGKQYDSVEFTFDIAPGLVATTSATAESAPGSIEAATPAAGTTSQAKPPTPRPLLAPTRRYASVPVPLPLITVTNHISTSADNYIFVNTATTNTVNSYLMILDNRGELVYYKELPTGQSYTDFKKQPNGLLTYFDGALTEIGGGNGIYRVLDSSYNLVDGYHAGNGYRADSHDILLLPNDHALLMIYHEESMDMTAHGGKPDAKFTDYVVQELDRSRNVVFQWRASEYLTYTETYADLTGANVDPYHGNSIEVLPDGNFLISLRHFSQIIKLNRQTGDIIWRMGGRYNDFTFANDDGFSYQHDARWLPNGRMTVFDNGNQRSPPFSRAVEYEVDETNMIVTRTWQYSHDPSIYGAYMGNAQRLPDDNTWIGWGGPRPIASEVTPDGKLAQDIEIGTPGQLVYRWFKLPWKGDPETTPALVAKTEGMTTTLYYSWNGATEVASYRIEAGKTKDDFELIKTQVRQGFETSTALSDNQMTACYYRVTALDKAGQDMRSSNIVRLPRPDCT